MVVTLAGMVTCVSFSQYEKACSLMVVTPFGMVTLVKSVQYAKARSTMRTAGCVSLIDYEGISKTAVFRGNFTLLRFGGFFILLGESRAHVFGHAHFFVDIVRADAFRAHVDRARRSLDDRLYFVDIRPPRAFRMII